MTYTYTINKIFTTPVVGDLVDVVTEIEYSYNASEGTGDDKVTATIGRNVKLGDPIPTDFTDYDELTEANVCDFVKELASVEEDRKLLQYIIAQKQAPSKVEKPLPWA
jgi:hypothetical protein